MPIEEIKLLNMGEIETRELRWFWYPYIPYGNATMIFGPGGHGKSYLSAALASSVSLGTQLPGQREIMQPGKVLMLSAEDDPHIVLRPRLEEMGAALENIYVPSEQFELNMAGVKKLRRFMKETKAQLVTIDPMVSYIGGKVDMNKMNEVRAVLGQLQGIAMETGAVMLLFHHSRKTSNKEVSEEYERAAGSADFINAVRSAMMVQRASNGEDYLLKHVKANYGPLGNSIGFKFGQDPIFAWGDFYTKSGATAYLSTRVRPQREAARAFIISTLKDGPMLSADVLARGKDEGFSRSTVYRAFEGIGKVRYVKKQGTVVTLWELDNAAVIALTGAEVAEGDPKAKLTDAIARLNAKLIYEG